VIFHFKDKSTWDVLLVEQIRVNQADARAMVAAEQAVATGSMFMIG
jgi:hypothetical protein